MKIGCDIIKIKRISSLSPESLKKIFHPSELKNKDPLHLAGIFAVKESCKKIFQKKNWLDFEIKKQRNGKPILKIRDLEFKGDISISHDGEYAIAVVISENE